MKRVVAGLGLVLAVVALTAAAPRERPTETAKRVEAPTMLEIVAVAGLPAPAIAVMATAPVIVDSVIVRSHAGAVDSVFVYASLGRRPPATRPAVERGHYALLRTPRPTTIARDPFVYARWRRDSLTVGAHPIARVQTSGLGHRAHAHT